MKYLLITFGFTAFVKLAFAYTITTQIGDFPDATRPALDIYDNPLVTLQKNSVQTHQIPAGTWMGLSVKYKNPATNAEEFVHCDSSIGNISKPVKRSLYLLIKYNSDDGSFTCKEMVGHLGG